MLQGKCEAFRFYRATVTDTESSFARGTVVREPSARDLTPTCGIGIPALFAPVQRILQTGAGADLCHACLAFLELMSRRAVAHIA